MRTSHVLTTGAVLVAIGGCAAVVIGFAAAQPAEHKVSASLVTTSAASTPAADPSDLLPVAAPSRTPTHSPSRRPSTTPHPATSSRHPQATHPSTTSHAAPKPVTHAAPKPASTPAPRRGQALPLGYSTGSATRVITVVAPSTGSTTALLQAWYKAPGGGWLRYGSTVTAHVGSQGLTTHPSESKSATPIGSFSLTQAFGRASDPGTALPYFRTDSHDWWVSDANSRYYNTHYRCASGSCPFNTGAGENLYAAGFVYTYAVVIDYNRFPVTRGAGSAFFLHVTNGSATAGCVAISQSKLVSLMRWMSPSTHPRILIGVS